MCPESSGRSQLLPSLAIPPAHPGEQHRGPGEPAWEAMGRVHPSAPDRLVKAPQERPSGRGLSRLRPSVLHSVPVLEQVGSEPTWLWDLDTFTVQFTKALWEALPSLLQATDLTLTLGCQRGTDYEAGSCPQGAHRQEPRKLQCKAERAPYLRGGRERAAEPQSGKACHCREGSSAEKAVSQLNPQDEVGRGQVRMARRACQEGDRAWAKAQSGEPW